MEIKECAKCSARWINGELYWATGKVGKEEDLAGLVCNNFGDEQCINPKKGDKTGDNWEDRLRKMKEDLDHPELPNF